MDMEKSKNSLMASVDLRQILDYVLENSNAIKSSAFDYAKQN